MITVQVFVKAPVEKVWKFWTEPEHIVQWAFASDDWEAPAAENDVRVGGKFTTTMAAKDGSAKFDFTGRYTVVIPNEKLEYAIEDGRKVTVEFTAEGDKTKVTESFDAETINSEEQQRAGWQAILENFRKHVEINRV